MSSLSIVMPVYANPEVLSLVLYGYTQQTDPDFTLFIVNDGGRRELQTVIDSYRDRLNIQYQYLEPETSEYRIAQTRNKAIRQVQTPRFVCMDSDVVPYPNLVELHKQYGDRPIIVVGLRKHISVEGTQELTRDIDSFFVRSKEYVNAYCDLLEVYTWRDDERYEYSEATEWKKRRHRIFMVATRPGKKSPEICYGHGLGMPTEKVKRIGGFWEKMVGYGWEDIELATRLCKAGCTTLVDPRIAGYHLGHPEVASKESGEARERNMKLLSESSAMKHLLRNNAPL